MKKLLSIVAILLLLVLLVGCIPDGLIPNLPDKTPSEQNPPAITDPSDTDPDKTDPPPAAFEDYGLPIIDIDLSKVHVEENGLYTSMDEVAVYLHLYHKLPSNFAVKNVFNKKDVTPENKLSTGGDTFYNREGLLPGGKSYRECDIDYHGGSRNALRIVYSVTDWCIFYTNDHYESFSILRFFE